MIFHRLRLHIRAYGYRRLVTSPDIIIAGVLSISLYMLEYATCNLSLLSICISPVNRTLVSQGVRGLRPLISVIVTGLAILASFSDRDFLSELADIEVFRTIIFVFEYTIFLSISALVIGILLLSYGVSRVGFFMFLFFFSYTIMSVLELVQLLASVSINKAEWAD